MSGITRAHSPKVYAQIFCCMIIILGVLFIATLFVTNNFDGAWEDNDVRDAERLLFCNNECTPSRCSHSDVKDLLLKKDKSKWCTKDGEWKDVGLININYIEEEWKWD